jgi:hypothetical protein
LYTISLKAVNINGPGPASVDASGIPATIPDPPTNVKCNYVSLTELEISFTDSSNNGGMPITGYTYNYSYVPTGSETYTQVSAGQSSGSTNTISSPITLSNLSSGAIYTITLQAINAIGPSVASNSAIGITATVPDQPPVILDPKNDNRQKFPTANWGGGDDKTYGKLYSHYIMIDFFSPIGDEKGGGDGGSPIIGYTFRNVVNGGNSDTYIPLTNNNYNTYDNSIQQPTNLWLILIEAETDPRNENCDNEWYLIARNAIGDSTPSYISIHYYS